MWDDWLHRLRGFVTIELEGPFCERFINLCIKKNIHLWGMHRSGAKITCNISARGFFLLRPMAKKTKTSVRIIEKYGLPFFLKKYRKRHFFIPGFLIFAFILGELSSFVWFVEPVGMEHLTREEILELLSDAGLSPGTKKRSINPGKIQREVLLLTDDIVWLWADVRGVKAYVSIKESTPVPEMLPTTSPSNIVAAYDGVIESVEARNGQTLVAEGDTVAKGDLLISGVMESKLGTARLVHAHGNVRARTWLEVSRECSLQKEIRTPTGRTKKAYHIKILNFSINLFGNSRNIYENYDKITTRKELTLFGKKLPVTIFATEYQEMTCHTERMEPEEAKEQMTAVLLRETAKELEGADILEKKAQIVPLSDDRIQVILRIESSREIGETVPIGEEKLYGD